eukprot:TRINITY_DN69314_c0_g1_i1.p1 TRINITY_DN69314_c0_g1~~TRINITY_DN69314_c0_g1_i1.p1  ORF type:complete len:215 (+),score=49.00 TRINITY_DN69314_c0_g1_i1:62-706(+)
MGQGLDILSTCDGEGCALRQRNEMTTTKGRVEEEPCVSCASLEAGLKSAVASAKRGNVQLSGEVLANFELLQHARQGNAKGLSEALEKNAWTETRRPLVMKPQKTYDADGRAGTDVQSSGMTPIMFSAQFGSVECVRRLLWANAEVNAVEEDGWSSLHFAAKECHLEVCQTLLVGKADPRLQTCEDQTPLQVAEEEDVDFAKQFRALLKKQGSA